MVVFVRRWLPIKLIGDGAYSCLTLRLTCAMHDVALIAPLSLDACLCASAPELSAHQEGLPRIRVSHLPKLSRVLVDA